MKRLTAAAASTTTIVALLLPQAAIAKSCAETIDFNLHVVSARDMSCARAARELESYEGPITRRFKTPHEFRCKRVAGERLSGKWRCRKSGMLFRFTFGD